MGSDSVYSAPRTEEGRRGREGDGGEVVLPFSPVFLFLNVLKVFSWSVSQFKTCINEMGRVTFDTWNAAKRGVLDSVSLLLFSPSSSSSASSSPSLESSSATLVRRTRGREEAATGERDARRPAEAEQEREGEAGQRVRRRAVGASASSAARGGGG